MTPYNMAGRKHRLEYVELFDVTNIDADGGIVDPETPRGHAHKVIQYPSYGNCLPRLTECRATSSSTSTPASTTNAQDIRSSWCMNSLQTTLVVV